VLPLIKFCSWQAFVSWFIQSKRLSKYRGLETVKNDVCDTEIGFSGEIGLEGISVTPPNITLWGWIHCQLSSVVEFMKWGLCQHESVHFMKWKREMTIA